jgi:hypothetical protein
VDQTRDVEIIELNPATAATPIDFTSVTVALDAAARTDDG